MIKLVLPEVCYMPEIGDVLWPGAQYLLSKKHVDDFFSQNVQKKDIVPLCWLNLNPIKALKLLKIDDSVFKSSNYQCPYFETNHHGIVPYALVGDKGKLDTYKDKTDSWRNWIFDFDFSSSARGTSLAEGPSDILKLALGSGYTIGTLCSDGSGSIIKGLMKLEDGHYLAVFFWEWYNK